MLFGILFASAFFYFYPQTNEKKPDVGNTIATGFIVTTLVMTLFIPFYVETFGFADWARKFESEALNQTGFVPISKTGIYDGRGLYGFDWGWTNPTLSILLRGNAGGGILDNNENGWKPFAPEELNENPLGEFEKRGRLYR